MTRESAASAEDERAVREASMQSYAQRADQRFLVRLPRIG